MLDQTFHAAQAGGANKRSEEHTSELQSQSNLVCRLLLEKKKQTVYAHFPPYLNPARYRPLTPSTEHARVTSIHPPNPQCHMTAPTHNTDTEPPPSYHKTT